MLGGSISATHCRELSAGDLHDPGTIIHTSNKPLGPHMMVALRGSVWLKVLVCSL